MEHHKKLRIALAAQSALWLVACGGGGGNSADPVTTTPASTVNTTNPVIVDGTAIATPTIAVSGKVLNVGYLTSTLVCADLDNDSACDSDEPQATTDTAGAYRLSVPAGHRGGKLLAVVRPATTDTATTTSAPIAINYGWTLAAPLEYDDAATSVVANISPITTTYYARLQTSGRNRLSTRIAMFTRIIYGTNIDALTGNEILPVDFDYVANPQDTDGGLADRVRALTAYLSSPAGNSSHPANTNPAALTLLQTTGVANAWYNTYTAATTSVAGTPVDAAKINTLATASKPAAYIANAANYYKLKSIAAAETRGEMGDTASIAGYAWYRDGSALKYLNLGAKALANGAIYQKFQQWMNGVWTPVTITGDESLTLDPQGQLVVVSGTDNQQTQVITYADGNRLTYRSPLSQTRLSLDTSTRVADNSVISEWFGQQSLSYANYYSRSSNTVVTSTPTTQPACSTGSSSSASTWFSNCVTTYRNAWFTANGGGSEASNIQDSSANAEYYDATLRDNRVDIPLTQLCGSGTDTSGTAISLPKVSVLGKSLCNWAVDSNANHTLADLFSTSGVTINSGSKYYGVSTYNASASAPCVVTGATSGTCTLPAASGDQGLPVRLKLKLARTGSQTSGTGTLSSDIGAWSTTSNTATTEIIRWEISRANSSVLLISYPFRNAGDPRKNTTTVSTSNVVAGTEAAPTLTAHFATSIAPSTHTSPNYRKFAIALQDGVFVTGYQFGAGFTEAERHLNKRGIELGIAAIQDVIAKVSAAGFK
jgi:hypothetical protein